MRVNRLGRGALLGGLLLLAGCMHSSQIQRQALPDGSYRVDCGGGRLRQCLTAIEEVCPKGYDVVQASEDVRYRGPIEPNEPYVKSEVIARCRTDEIMPGGVQPKPAEPASSGAAPAPATPQRCFPGATQACVGPGACQGGQQCLPDGAAFGPCECGAGPPPPGADAAAPR
jgi:hypothetical protein